MAHNVLWLYGVNILGGIFYQSHCMEQSDWSEFTTMVHVQSRIRIWQRYLHCFWIGLVYLNWPRNLKSISQLRYARIILCSHYT